MKDLFERERFHERKADEVEARLENGRLQSGGIFDCNCACASAPAAPDYSNIASSNTESAQIAAETAANDLAFRKQQYEDSKPQQAALVDLATKVANQQLDQSQFSGDQAKSQWNTYQNTYKPIENQSALESMGGLDMSDDQVRAMATQLGMDPNKALAVMNGVKASNDNSADAALTSARADVNNVYAQGVRGLTRYGGDPNKMATAAAGLASGDTLSEVAAANNARNVAKTQGISLRAGTAAFGRNMPNTANQTVGVSTNAGNSAVGNSTAAANSWIPAASYVSGAVPNTISAANLATQGTLGLGGLMSSNYNAQLGYTGAMNQASMNQGSGFGQVLGAALGGWASGGFKMPSDIRLKTNLVKVGETAKGFGLYVWDWIWGGSGFGVLAQEVEKVIPEAVDIDDSGWWKRVDYALIG
jgi:hypothetical protein